VKRRNLKRLCEVLLVRALSALVTVVVLLTAVFFFIRVLPGDPALVLVPEGAPESVLQEIRSSLGLDLPIHVQFADFMLSVFSGNLGRSWNFRVSVYALVIERLPTTIELACLGIVFAFFFGVVGGTFAAKNQGNYKNYLFRILTLLFFATPVFVSGPVLQYLFAVRWGFLPATGRIGMDRGYVITNFVPIDALLTANLRLLVDWSSHMLMPSVILGLYLSATMGRLTIAETLNVMKEDFVLTAQAKGLKDNVVLFKHVLRNALVPIVTAMGFQFAGLLSGAVILESIFNLSGVGSLLVGALGTRDFPLIQGTLVFTIIFVAAMSIILDIVYALIDPRVRR